MADCLIEIKRNDWAKLEKIYSPESARTVLGLHTIKNYIRWTEKDPNIESLKFYSLNGDWNDGTFLVTDRYHIFFDSLNSTNDKLAKILDLLDYSKGVRFMHIRDRHYSIVIDLIKRKHLEVEYDDPFLLYYAPKEDVTSLNVQVPDNFYCRPLNANDVVKANDLWMYNHPGSLFYLRRLAALNPSCGVFTRVDDEMVSSVFQIQTGLFGILFTSPEYRNQRLGQAVVDGLCREVLRSGSGITTSTREKNTASRAIFEKLGCKIIDKVHWIATPCEWTEEATD